jgi:hypothetical protein
MAIQERLKRTIRNLLAQRGEGKTICPSEVARAAAGSEARAQWEPLMEPVREAAAAMAEGGEIVVTQRGHAVDARTAKGPIRLRLH